MRESNKQKRQFWVILLIVFLGFVGISMPYLIFPSLFLKPANSILPADWGNASRAIFLGITLAAYPLGQFIGSPILGSLSDDYGRKRLLSASLIVSAVANLFSGFAIAWQNLSLLILTRFVAGIMEGNIAIARAMASDLKSLSKHKTFGKINAAASIAYLLGPLLGGLLVEKDFAASLTMSTPFYLTCFLFVFLALVAELVLEETFVDNGIAKRSFGERINIISRMSELFTNRTLQFLMIVSTVFTLAVDIYYEFGPVYLTVKWAMSPSQLVLYNGVVCLALVVGNGWLPGFVSSRYSSRKAIIYSIIGFALVMLGMALTNSTLMMMVSYIISGLTIGLGVTLITVKISNTAPDDIQGEVMGVQMSLRVLGDAVICLAGGALLLFSAELILTMAGILSAWAAWYYIRKA